MPRTFTLEEARALLPRVREIAEALQAGKLAFDSKRSLVKQAERVAKTNGHGPAGSVAALTETEQLARDLQQRIAELNGLGVEVKGLDQGLVDFPSMREGRVVYLCWRVGEPDIAWWHELDTGFAGRQPL
jgi:hypothetical protein